MALSAVAGGGVLAALPGGLLGAVGIVLALALAAVALMLNGNPLKRRHPKAPPVWSVGAPLLGNALSFAKHPLKAVTEGYHKVGPVFTMKLMGKDCTFLIGPKAQSTFFGARDDVADSGPPYLFMAPVFGKGILYDAPMSLRFQQMKFAATGLKSASLHRYVPDIVKECNLFVDKWGESGEIDLMEELGRMIILTASRSLMGSYVREHLFDQVADLFHQLDQGITPISFFFPNAPIPQHRRRNAAREAMVRLFSDVIKARRDSGKKENDILQTLIDARYNEKNGGGPLPDAHISGLMIALLFAGQHTSTITTCWTMLEIINNKDYTRRAQEELERVLGGGKEITYDRLSEMDFLYNCMKESTRAHPPLIYVMREALTDIPVLDGKYVIPKGHRMFASPAVGHRVEEAFSRPNEWLPDRYVEPMNEGGNGAYAGFGAGMHACQGERFAYMQIRSIMSVLLTRFEFEPVVPGIPEPNYDAMVVPPKNTHTRLRYKARAR